MKKAQVTFNDMNQNDMSDIDFKLQEAGWWLKFMKRNGLSLLNCQGRWDKLKPMVVFKGAKWESTALNEEQW